MHATFPNCFGWEARGRLRYYYYYRLWSAVKMGIVSKPEVKAAVWVHFGFKPNGKGEPHTLDETVYRLCRIVCVKSGNE